MAGAVVRTSPRGPAGLKKFQEKEAMMNRLTMCIVLATTMLAATAIAPAATIFQQDGSTAWTLGTERSTGTLTGSNPVTLSEMGGQRRVWASTPASLGVLGDYTEEKIVWTFDLRSLGGQLAVILGGDSNSFDGSGSSPADSYIFGVDGNNVMGLGSSDRGGKNVFGGSGTQMIIDSGITLPDSNTVTVSVTVEYYTADDTWALAVATTDGNAFTTAAPVADTRYTGKSFTHLGPYSRSNDWMQLEDYTIKAIPEPMTLGLVALGGTALLRRRRR
jgi:hypothetical protein